MRATLSLVVVGGFALASAMACNRPTETNRQAEEWNSKSDYDSHDRLSDGMGREKLKNGDVADIDIGRTVRADGAIGDKTRSFKPSEPIHIAVDTKHIAVGTTVNAVLRQKSGAIIAEQTATLSGNDPGFHVEKTDGLPVGDYVVEISLSNGNTMTQSFEVR